MGKPPKKDILVPLNQDLIATLDRIAEEEEVARLEIIRRSIKQYVRNYLANNTLKCTVESEQQAA